eukprot:963615-Ditylum_brightwellii.AAC.1
MKVKDAAPIEPVGCYDPTRGRAHTLSDSADIQGLKVNIGVEEDSDSSSGCTSPTHIQLVFQQKDGSVGCSKQLSSVDKSGQNRRGKKKSEQRERDMNSDGLRTR